MIKHHMINRQLNTSPATLVVDPRQDGWREHGVPTPRLPRRPRVWPLIPQ